MPARPSRPDPHALAARARTLGTLAPRPATWRRRLRHPRVAMAVRAAVAATLAWLIALRLPGGQEYAFYAPFGATVTTYTAVVRSTRETFQAVGAIGLGALVGLAADGLVPWPAVAVTSAVAVGVLLGGLPWLGDSRTYVPVAATFVLLIGQGQEVGYAVSYAGMFLMGALVTIGLNVAFPTLPLAQARSSMEALREEAAHHLRHMAGVLREDDVGAEPPRTSLGARLARARDAVDDLTEAARGNRRARHQHGTVEAIRTDFAALERVAQLVDDLHELSEDAPWSTRVRGVTDELRQPMATAVATLADVVTSSGLTDTEPGGRLAADAAVGELAAALLRYERSAGPGPQGLVVATVVTTLRRSLSALTPSDRIDLSPSPWPEAAEAPPERAPERGPE
ncbi:hypothetical protein [Cellulomonas sp. ATA003]|uniref:hypothetical protein n=1 Tax=Cellulomonas sp. ATA003 TaxID=3073064 RepID=UPI002872E299|nr:hypothetical protein [Cellulomonas sp. ATA003]WNB85117.1 hypothetical protein REH70_15885 [Cellulomonas sp. ATA003]